MSTIKKILVEFFFLFFPQERKDQNPKKHELVFFYTIFIGLVLLSFFLLH